VFDKTGTLTTSVANVTRFDALPAGRLVAAELLRLVAGAEADVPHPAARALVAHARVLGIEPATADAALVMPGGGVVGEVEGHRVAIGRAALLAERGHMVDDPDGRWIWIEVDGRVAGRCQVQDTVDPAAAAVIGWLRSRGFRLALLTGATRADDVVPQLIAPSEAHCSLTADGKVALVRELAATGRIAMVGDGLNDALALAAADVGIAVGRASDLARLAADVVMVQGGVAELPRLVALARRTVRIARQNLGWAFGYNAIALALAAGACLTPVVAALAMLASSATVLANARRLRPRPSPSVALDVGEPQLTAASFAATRS
jgi:P-type E1-E2 ATPase